MPISKNFSSEHIKEWGITFLQCYPNGYLKYTDLCNIIQLTAAEHAELGGISFSDMQLNNQAWVLSRMRVEINKMPKWKETIVVKTWIISLENSRSIRGMEILLNGVKIIGCETFWAVFNTKSRKPENLAITHNHFEKFPNKRATDIQFSKININIDTNNITEKTVLLSDLDIVNHANSVKYLEWCLDYVDTKLLLKQQMQSFEMNYLKEVSLNEKVSINKSKSVNPMTFLVSSTNNSCFALKLNFA